MRDVITTSGVRCADPANLGLIQEQLPYQDVIALVDGKSTVLAVVFKYSKQHTDHRCDIRFVGGTNKSGI